MESMNEPKKPCIMARLRNSKGFSLIEMAIVLVIIGIIIAAIIKGQDLMLNSRAKQLVSTANAWKIAAYGYMDRNGTFPGASASTGLIDSTTNTAITSIASTMAQAPQNPVVIGGQSFYFYLSSADGSSGLRNVIVACPSNDCSTTLTTDDVEMFKVLDTSIDGSADASAGQLRSLTSASVTAVAASPTTYNRAVASPVTAITPGTTSVWPAGAVGAVWYFDKPY